jgi:DNA topoisomerase-2
VLFGCFKKKLKSEMKVAQLAGYIAEQTSYHHGEQSLYTTIVSMAQNFVGSNNLPLLSPNGQFGTRLAGGKDSASPRYIFTNLTEHARKVFPESDDPLLAAQFDDGLPIEPANYVPVIPTLLVNGVAGIGTGWSTSVPQYGRASGRAKRARERKEGAPLTKWVAPDSPCGRCRGERVHYERGE